MSIKMDKMIVDPELFITCRLCLVQRGQYQIVPSVQKQIKFCFDIDVEPFDGLPQLICKDCELILSKYNIIKANFQKKQQNLKSGVSKYSSINEIVGSSTLQEQDDVTSTETTEEKFKENLSPLKFVLKKKESRSIDGKNNTCKGSDSCASTYSIVKKSKPKHSKYSSKWRNHYEKLFSCRFCSNCYKDKKSIPKHFKKHEAFLSQYNLKHCSVPVIKEDGKKNLTGLPNTVVLDSDKIIQHLEPHYSVLYKRKAKYNASLERSASSDSSVDGYPIKRKTKRLQLLSDSSSETIKVSLLEGSTKKEKLFKPEKESENKDNKTIECVDIGDSSESDSERKDVKNNSTNKIISNTIASCLYKYVNRCNSSENYKDSLLMHKDLTIGMKIIEGKPFSCSELLRFLGYSHLNVEWIPRSEKRNNNNGVQVKIKLKESVAHDRDIGWKKLSTFTKANDDTPLHDLLEKINAFNGNFHTINKSSDDINVDSAILISNEADINIQTQNDSSAQLRILLNTSPVANPKQLPKKGKSLYINSFKVTSGNSTQSGSQETHMAMPIIMQAVSLASAAGLTAEHAVVESNNLLEDTSINTSIIEAKQPQFPRIKVKPVSQLMPATSSGIISSTSTPNWNTPVTTLEIPLNDNYQTKSGKENIGFHNEGFIMHTVELPNMKTSSPFLYLQKLLRIHNIGLLNCTEPMPQNFVCLIKFKPIFNQDNQKSVTLGTGLFGDSRDFVIKLKDVNTGIDIKSLSPRWQWEVIQLYKDQEIVTKLLDNAKNISQKMYDATKYFITLLRCIIVKQC